MSVALIEADKPSANKIAALASTSALSRRQTLLWLDEQLYPAVPFYNQVLTIEVRGPLDVARLRQAWAATVAAHDSLRTVIDAREPRQWVSAAPPPPLPEVSLPDEGAVPRWIADNCVRPLRDEARWNAALLCLPGEHHVFYLCVHQIVADGLSLSYLADYLGRSYLGEKLEKPGSFADYLRHEAGYQKSPRAKADDAYWSARLVPAVPPVRLYGRSRTDRSVGLATVWRDCGAERATRLLALAAQEPWKTVSGGLSRLVVMATALATFLYRASGQREVLIGVPFRNRVAPFARTSGLVMEQVFARIEIDEGETYATLAAKTARELRETIGRGRACVSERGLECVTLNMLPPFPEKFAGLEAEFAMGVAPTWPGVHAPDAGDLRDTFGMQLFDFSSGKLQLGFTFHAATFDEHLRQRMVDHFIRVLDAMASNQGAAIDGVDLLDDTEKSEILAQSRGPEPEGVAADVVEKFRAQAARRPDHPAVEGPEGTFSYAAFDRLTDALARKLRAMGVERESRVGVALPRGVREIAALMATLKAGGAYVPVDPSHPVDRVKLILEDAAPEVLIAPSGSPLAAALPPSAKLLALDEVPTLADTSNTPLDGEVANNQLAYILFTSGSTGRPKGVEIPRSAFANFQRAMTVKPGLAEGDRLLAITTTTFDIAGLELFLPLYVGATVVIADRDTGADPRRLAARLERGDISVLQATPASWRLLLESGWKGDGKLRMLCGGEAMSPELAEKLTTAGSELWNVYGPTETTVWSTLERIEKGASRITIGRPIDYTQIYVLDGGRKLAPAGVVGELYIGGRGLARGYRGRPDLTAERFIPDPFGVPGDRIYRTGDLARLLPDGRFECLGRVDHQVKIRGFRIELGEIESVLRGVPGAKEVLVVADSTRRADPLLCAYWVGDATREALLQRATARLPSYMVPSAYVQVPVFPLNSNGKIDRKALPPPEVGAAAPTEGIAPAGIAQERMAAIWSELLGIQRIGVDQSFFDLGGTSVLAIQARAAIEKSFGVELPLRAFFETPTIAELIEKLGSKDNSTEPIVMMLRRGKGDTLPVHCLVGVEIYRDLAQSLDGEWPVIAIHVPLRYVPGREPLPSVMELATHYVKAIRGRQAAGPYHLAGLCFGGIVAYEAARQLEAAGETVATVTIFDGYLPSALSVDRPAQLLDYAQRAISTPGRILSKVRAKVSNSLARFNRQSRAGAAHDKPVDLPLDGPEVDEQTHQYELARDGVLRSGHLIIFRATGRGWQPWMQLQPDLGWGKLAARISVHELNCDHLDLVRQPHVREVAAFMQAALVTDSPRQASSLSVSQRLRAPDSIPAMSQRSGPR